MRSKLDDGAPSACRVDHSVLRKLGTGIYEDPAARYLHFCLLEICAESGHEPTSRNLDIAEDMLRAIAARQWAGLPILIEPAGEALPPRSERH